MSLLLCFILAFVALQLTTGENRTSCVSDPSLYLTMPFKCHIPWPPQGDGALEVCGSMVGLKRRVSIWLQTSGSKNVPLRLDVLKNKNIIRANSRVGGGRGTNPSGRVNWGQIITGKLPTDFEIKKNPFCVLVTEKDNKFVVRLRYGTSTHKLLEFPDRKLGVPSKLKVAKQFNVTFAGMTE